MIKFKDMIKDVRVLLVDDDQDYVGITELSLRNKGYNIDVVNTGKEALEILSKNNHQIVLLDYFIGDMTGEQVVKQIREYDDELIIILQTGFSGEKPPVEMMEKLKIQNYHDKTDGIEKLTLQLMSAVRIFSQQQAIELSKFRFNIIGQLMNNVSVSIKTSLSSMSAGIEISNMLLNEADMSKEKLENLNKYYKLNKTEIEKIDQVVSAISRETSEEKNDILSDKEIIAILKLLSNSNELREKNIDFQISSSLRDTSFIFGGISELIFLISEIIFRIIEKIEDSSKLSVILTEDEKSWYFRLESNNNITINAKNKNLYKNILNTLMKNEITFNDKEIVIKIDR